MSTTTWTMDAVVDAIAADSPTTVGHLALGQGVATLPSALDGSPVSVSPEVALEALQRYQGDCWVDGDGHLVGWPEDDDSGPDDGPAAPADPAALSTIDLVDWIVEAMYAEQVQHVGNLTLGQGGATLPAAEDGAPVKVSAAESAEAIQRFGGWCWVDERDRLVGWPSGPAGGPEDGPAGGPEVLDGPESGPAWRVLDEAALDEAAGCRALDARHEGLVALETAARPDVVWLAAVSAHGRWLATDPHGVLWASWDGEALVVGSWRHDLPPTWAKVLERRVRRAVPVEDRW